MIHIGGEDYSKHLPDNTKITHRRSRKEEWITSDVVDDRIYKIQR